MEAETPFDCCPEQRFTCSRCGRCCNTLEVMVTAAEKAALGRFHFKPALTLDNAFRPRAKQLWELTKTADGRCFFMNDQGLCRIHSEGGEKLKPLACRLYPLVVHHWNDGHISADCRYYCPAVGQGEPLEKQEKNCRAMAELLKYTAAPAGVTYSRENPAGLEQVRRVNAAFQLIMTKAELPLSLRLYMAARILAFHAQRDMHSAVAEAGPEFAADALEFIAKAEDNLREEYNHAPHHDLNLRVKFRLASSGFYRDDAPHPNLMYRIKRARTMYRWTTGRGSLHELNASCPDTSNFDFFSTRAVHRFSEEALQELEIFIRAKLDAMHHCGPAALNFCWEDGVRHLLLAAAAAAAGAGSIAGKEGRPHVESTLMRRVLCYVDTTFRLSPFFRTRQYRISAVGLCRPERYAGLLKAFFNE